MGTGHDEHTMKFINEINEQTSPQLTSEQLWRMLQLKIREFT